ncbi:hypothetical protein EV193_103407 [Herbihabitans rhizosphaerae]|uniref:Uncharacterized protein n=1 Tax=Herbihabitans rhizosphaerae TaxID=1872711 RepID=A0A4Q7KVN3_9PSEU|nr:hypothetical protein [Herbihabitans rhizosphaerae]RZS41089.1 hypothetical protein EV193_103407 [Herbihabitans rhizosphaerae]
MSIARRIAVPATGAVLTAAALVLAAPTASAHPGHPHSPAQPGIHKGDPLAGPDFFASHLDRYHWGRTLFGFTRAAEDPYDWLVYHFLPTNLETVTRTVSPGQAPAVEGDTWVETPAREAGPDHGHGPPSHAGQALRAPIDPTAGLEYLARYGAKPDPATAVPALREAVRRTVTPTEDRPPNTVDKWSDKRPAGGAESGRVLLPAEVASVPANASKTVGRFVGGVLDSLAGTSPNSGPVGLLPIGGLLPSGR